MIELSPLTYKALVHFLCGPANMNAYRPDFNFSGRLLHNLSQKVDKVYRS